MNHHDERLSTILKKMAEMDRKLEVLQQIVSGNVWAVNSPQTNPRVLIEKVAQLYGLSTGDLRGPGRDSHVVTARHMAMLLLRETQHLNVRSIGRLLHRDYSGVSYGCSAMRNRIETDERTRHQYERLVRGITPRSLTPEPTPATL